MWVVRKLLSPTEGAPPRTRVNPDTGEVETNVSGDDWVEDPRSDPRQNPAYMLPPPSAPDVKCAAAAGMVENVRRVVEGAAGGTTVAAIATVLLTLLLIPGIGWMFAAMLLFASSFVAAGSAAVLAAFTEDVYDFLLCSFYENIDADGKVSWEQLEAVQVAAAAEFPDPLVGDILAGIMQMHREVGFTNAGVVYADAEADCTCEPTWCKAWDFTLDDGSADGWYIPGGAGGFYGDWSIGTGYFSVVTGGNNVIYIENDTLAPSMIYFNLTYIKTGGSGPTNINEIQVYDAGGVVALDNSNEFTDDEHPRTKEMLGDWANITQTIASLNAGTDSSAIIRLLSIRLEGHGENPWGEDDC